MLKLVHPEKLALQEGSFVRHVKELLECIGCREMVLKIDFLIDIPIVEVLYVDDRTHNAKNCCFPLNAIR